MLSLAFTSLAFIYAGPIDLQRAEIRTPVCWRVLQRFLKMHPDRDFAMRVVNGFRYGFSLGLAREPQPWADPPNRPLVEEKPNSAWDLICTEIKEGAVLGPFDVRPLPNLLCTPINIVEKEMSSGKFHLIQDLSYPWGDDSNGVNAMVPSQNKKVKYQGVDTVIEMAQCLRPHFPDGLWGCRMDICQAFRQCPIRPSEWHLMGFKFHGQYFMGTQLPFGASASCKVFEDVAQAIEWILKNRTGVDTISHYLDDFFLLRGLLQQLSKLMRQFHSLVDQQIGLPVALNKTIGPLQCVAFLWHGSELYPLLHPIAHAKTQEMHVVDRVSSGGF